jgi:RES domain-containing protein
VTPLPGPLGGAEIVVWRLHAARFAPTWDSGEGAFRFGGRWNSPGRRVVYCSFDPSTALVEVAAHLGFDVFDAIPYTLTSATILRPGDIHVVQPNDIPNADWLRPDLPASGQRAYGDDLLDTHPMVAIPSAVSPQSWNLLIAAPASAGTYALRSQDRFTLDRRLIGDRP